LLVRERLKQPLRVAARESTAGVDRVQVDRLANSDADRLCVPTARRFPIRRRFSPGALALEAAPIADGGENRLR
jgi:hypothetical protein